MWAIVRVVMTILLLAGPGCTTGQTLKELSTDNLLLLNVAAKGRLVERLTDAITHLESARERMVDFVKSCFYTAMSKTAACQQCVMEACEKRATECQIDISAMETVPVTEDNDNIPGVEFLTSPMPVQMGLEGFTQHAEEDILNDIPSKLRVKGRRLLQSAEGKLHKLQEHLRNTVHELPGLFPVVRTAIDTISTDLDVDSFIDVADKAADSLSQVFPDGDLDLAVTSVMEQMPDIMTRVNEKMQQLTSVMGDFVSNAMGQIGAMISTPISIPVTGWVESPDGQIPLDGISEQMVQRPRNKWTMQHIRLNGGSGGSARGIFLSSSRFRFSRPTRSTVECQDIARDPDMACKSYHFRCSACMNDTAILKQSCGRESLRMMLTIKKIDMKAAEYLMTYSRHVKSGKVVLKVRYDDNSFDRRTSTYRTAYVTARIRDDVVTYETSSLPNFGNLSTSGGEIGDEIWMILDEDEHTTDGVSKKLNKITHQAGGQVSQSLQSSASTNSVVWGVVGMIMYLGFIAL